VVAPAIPPSTPFRLTQPVADAATAAGVVFADGVARGLAPRPLLDWNANTIAALADGASVIAVSDASGMGAPLYGADATRRPTKGTDADGKAFWRLSATVGNGQKMAAETLGVSEPALRVPRGKGTLITVVSMDDLATQPNANPVIIQGAGPNPPRLTLATASGGTVQAGGFASSTPTADVTSGQNVLRNLSAPLLEGTAISGAGIPAGSYISRSDGASATFAAPANATATATGTAVAITATGFTNNTRLFMPNIADGKKHVVVMRDDGVTSTLYVDNYFVSTISGSFFATGLVAPTIGVGSSASGNGSAYLSGNFYRVKAFDTVLSQSEMAAEVARLNAEHSVGLTLYEGTADAAYFVQDSSTSDTSGVRIFPPARQIAAPFIVLWCHPSGADRTVSSTYFAGPYARTVVGLGGYFAASDMGFAAAPGGQTRTWGNATAQNALALLRAKVIADYGLPSNTPTLLMGASMGGMASMIAIARQTLPAGVLKGVFLIDAALSMFDMYKTSYYGEIDTAYGVAAGTLSAASSAGATSVSSSVSYPAGTIVAVETGTANAELATVASAGPTGSGPYTIPLVAPLTNAHASGVRISDYGTKTAGYDPYVASTANFAGLPVRYTASNADVLVPIGPNSQQMQTKLAGIAADNGLLIHLLGHLAGGATNPAYATQFMRNIGLI
jgi:hypothetical protein